VVDPNVSSRMKMQQTKSTKIEILLGRECHKLGLRYRKNTNPTPDLKFKVDLVFKQHKLAVFANGCFWHGCRYHFITPKTNTDWWLDKIKKNKIRDIKQKKELKKEGWEVLVFWEHNDPEKFAQKILNHTKSV
tara:strand:+ start:124 stop:522 length:399 start_codon:yes stop_codon:yes gene_type:complete